MRSHQQPHIKGIFVQSSRDHRGQLKYWCVTFPRLGNLNQNWESETLMPSENFSTYNQALKLAIQVRKIDSRISEAPIYFLDQVPPKGRSGAWRRDIKRVA